MNTPKRLIIEFDDGSQREIEFSKLSRQIQTDIAEAGLCSRADEAGVSKSYMLLRWQNGWQEVLGVEKDRIELMRCYVTERIEENGRIALDTGDDYPVVIYLKRLPMQIESALLADNTGIRMHSLVEKATIKQGGTTEHILYDRKNPVFAPEDSGKTGLWLSTLSDSARKELEKKGLTSENVLSLQLVQRHNIYGNIARALGIRAMRTQADLYGFIELLLKIKKDEKAG